MTAKPVPEHISDELLPCPFCGGELVITKHFKMDVYSAVHRCKVVGSMSFDFQDRARIVSSWNTRSLTELQHRREAEAETPEGWKLIPRRPTEDMMQAGNYQSSHDSTSADVYSAWVDMWDAAPSPDEYENPSKLERKTLTSPSSPASGVRVTEAMLDKALIAQHENDPAWKKRYDSTAIRLRTEDMTRALIAALAVGDEGIREGDDGH